MTSKKTNIRALFCAAVPGEFDKLIAALEKNPNFDYLETVNNARAAKNWKGGLN